MNIDNPYVYNELCHHGVSGQKWGVRNGPPYPLKYTQRARNAAKTKEYVDNIINSMSKDDRDKVLAGSDSYLNYEEGSHVAKRVLKKIGDIPISFFDLLEDDTDTLMVALGTRSGAEYRGKGYGSKAAEQALKWLESNNEKYGYKNVIWGVRVDNIGSIKIALKNGFELDKDSYSEDGQWVNYVKKLK